MNKKQKALERARVIIQVQSGQMTATEAARQLGVSRKTYYQWEKRALLGMIHELEEKEPGRPARPENPEVKKLQEEKKSLEKKVHKAKRAEDLRFKLSFMKVLERIDEERDKKNELDW